MDRATTIRTGPGLRGAARQPRSPRCPRRYHRGMIELRGVGKSFGGVRALDGVSLAIERGECHALVGENGAGKSTLGRLLAGIHAPDAGEIRIDGRRAAFRSPRDALAAGIAMVHQELAFCPDLSVAENLSLGRWPRRGGAPWARALAVVDRAAMTQRARQLLARVGAAVDVRAPMRSLSVAQEQLVQIAAAVGSGARLLILDEPTSSLSETESRALFALLAELRTGGATLIYVSHRLPEVFALADRISVLRDGRLVATLPRAETSPDAVVRLMIGRELARELAGADAGLAPAPEDRGQELLRVEHLRSPGRLQDVSFSVHAGEIVGLAGLVGAGRSDVARAIFGLDLASRGGVSVAGRPLRGHSPRRAIAAGVALVPEDRKREGLLLGQGARWNWSLPILRRLRRGGLIDRKAERRQAAAAFASLDLRAASLEQPVALLSGGNQQKVLLGKWLSTGASVLLVDEPTRGVDVGAKAAIHALLRDQARAGAGVLLISSDLTELLALSSRLLVMRGGRLVGGLERSDATPDAVLRLMAGVEVPAARP